MQPGVGDIPGGGHGSEIQQCCRESPWTEKPGGLQSMGLQRVRHALVSKQQKQQCVYVGAALSIHSTFCPCCVHKSILYVCESIQVQRF